MGKLTPTLKDYLQFELKQMGKDESLKGYDFLLTNEEEFDDYHFYKKMINFDIDIESIVNRRLFYHEKVSHIPELDRYFKKMFVNRFLDKMIAFQTIDKYAQKIMQITIKHQQTLIYLFDNLDSFLKNQNESNTNSRSDSLNKTRSLYNELPQNLINLDLNNDILDHASNNTINNMSNNNSGNATTINSKNDIHTLRTIDNYLTNLLYEYEVNICLKVKI